MEKNSEENKHKKRSRTDVIFDIIRILRDHRGKMKPTPLMYKANLSFETLGTYMADLKKSGLVKESLLEPAKNNRTKRIIELTPKGNDFYANYSKMKEFEKTFGI